MKFRPCIDIHNGSVKQIIGGSLEDSGNQAVDNFVSGQNAAFYARKYREDGLSGGHIILLNPKGSEFYGEDVSQAKAALEEYPGGMQIGGGMEEKNAEEFLAMGASHIIVTSYVFQGGMIYMDRLKRLVSLLGKEHLVLDLSCRYVEDDYYIVTDRWQKVTKVKMNRQTMEMLSEYCDEFLIHAVDVEGKASGVEKEVVRRLGERRFLPVTYAGGIHSMEDIDWIRKEGNGFVDFTVGSALDLFGGTISYQELLKF
ncbi:phosphoribosylformimino-5-aminoimidazole carboxamide ribotide isomerase [bacterium D16-51]|nr:phosphoribosylformimino-5-aminoimidazole carboxamide ribotide isomerase [bacterium D16-59]RKI61881.1 phosphoribosylformimino-5-aminoimidazole carboxamide ribotide isomerase [bacterium D16-51]